MTDSVVIVGGSFSGALFGEGRRGIVLVKTFNEAPDVKRPTVQHTITPGDEPAIGIAFIWRQFEVADVPMLLLACCVCTVLANKLIASLPTDRMPAVFSSGGLGKVAGRGARFAG